MSELMYGISSIVIALLLLAFMAGALHLGCHLGDRQRAQAGEATRNNVNALQASLLGLLALLLGFTLSLSLQRHDQRSADVVKEADAIGTAYARARLTPEPYASELRALLREYTHERLTAGHLSIVLADTRGGALNRAQELQEQIWSLAITAPTEETNAALKTFFLQSLDQAWDQYQVREAGLERHVPEPVLWLLFLTFVATGGVVGYSMGLNGARTMTVTHIFVVLIVILVFIIIDLDRPRRGLLTVSQKSMMQLDARMAGDALEK